MGQNPCCMQFELRRPLTVTQAGHKAYKVVKMNACPTPTLPAQIPDVLDPAAVDMASSNKRRRVEVDSQQTLELLSDVTCRVQQLLRERTQYLKVPRRFDTSKLIGVISCDGLLLHLAEVCRQIL